MARLDPGLASRTNGCTEVYYLLAWMMYWLAAWFSSSNAFEADIFI